MQRNTLFTFCAATVLASTTALGIVMAKPASLLASRAWVGETSTAWHTAANWSGNAVPAAGDIVTVDPEASLNYKGDPVLSGSNGAAGDLRIGSGFTLTVTGVTLSLDLDVIHDIDGDLFLSNSSSKLEFKTNHATVDGDGAIIGQDNSAEIRIADDKTLTNEMVIRGKMIILDADSSGNFVNGSTGQVLANVAGTLRLQDLDLSGAGAWKAETNGSAILEFATEDLTGLSGDFTLSHNATLKFLASITTTGNFTTNPRCGLVDVDTNANVCFKATGNDFELCNNQTYSTGCP
ncbi:MAG: hypothetical protein V3U86_11015 [Acidobacteriota bacterium]